MKEVLLLLLFVICIQSPVAEPVYDPVIDGERYILTPAAKPEPMIHGPAVFGVRPGSPFLYAIPASGDKPMTYAVNGLPEGLMVNPETGVIEGRIEPVKEPRELKVKLVAENALGRAEKDFTIKVGDTICLTPPMGWNSWNCWGTAVDTEKVMDSAKAMVDKGLKDYGWSYINVDDAWQSDRRGGPFHAIQGHPERFPDLGKLCDDIHAMGLKVGMYSTPWITSYAGGIGGSSDDPGGMWDRESMGNKSSPRKRLFLRHGEHSFIENDVNQWAAWGIDYIKFDWKPNDGRTLNLITEALTNCARDIVFSISNTAPVEQGEFLENHVNCFRTTGDLKDRWDERGRNLNLRQVWQLHRTWMDVATRGGPGHFPDADMLVVGDVIEGHDEEPRPSRLTADEQYTHVTLWTLWSCPLLIGCPIERMDNFTLNLLTNHEVLAVHQDERAVPGRTVKLTETTEVIRKDLADGSKAVGLFNVSDKAQIVSIDFETIELKGEVKVRDLWRQTDLGSFTDSFSARIPPHGVVFIQVQ